MMKSKAEAHCHMQSASSSMLIAFIHTYSSYLNVSILSYHLLSITYCLMRYASKSATELAVLKRIIRDNLYKKLTYQFSKLIYSKCYIE